LKLRQVELKNQNGSSKANPAPTKTKSGSPVVKQYENTTGVGSNRGGQKKDKSGAIYFIGRDGET